MLFENSIEINIASQVFGYIGALLIISLNIPLLISIIKERNADVINIPNLILHIITGLIFITYGILIQQWPVIICNAIYILLNIIIIILKYVYSKNTTANQIDNTRNQIDTSTNIEINGIKEQKINNV